MSSITLPAAPDAPPVRSAAPGPDGDWPHTRRVLPWGIALLLVLLWLTPVNAINPGISGPFEASPDRVVLVGLALVWVAAMAAGGPGAPRLRGSPVHVAGFLYLCAVLASLLVGYERMVITAELALTIKRTALLLTYVTFFLIVASSVRTAEIRPFLLLLVALAAVAGAGTTLEYLSGTNYFYEWTDALLPAAIDVRFAPSGVRSGRPTVVGPTQHGLAVTTALAMVLPFALLMAVQARRRLWIVLSFAAVGLILAGAVATVRKTGLLAPATAVLVVVFQRPQQARRAVGAIVGAGVVMLLLVPAAARSVYDQLFLADPLSSNSTRGRLDDYDAIRPDVLSNLLIGRGYGSYDVLRYRILDNEILGQLLTVGVVGLVCLFGVLAAGAITARRAARSPEATLRLTGLGVTAALAAFAITIATYDALSFVQVPYLLLFLLGMATVAAASPAPSSPREDPARAGPDHR